MTTLLWILGATILNSLLAFVGIFTLWMKEKTLGKFMKAMMAFSAGVLLGGGFFHLLAESVETMGASSSFSIALIGFLLFFLLEEYLHWHNCEECEIHPYSYLMIVGDSIHNIIDGIVIAAAFIVSVPLGIITTLMIIGHELPQELGVFCVLVSGGIKKQTALFYSFIAQTTSIIGGLMTFFFLSNAQLLSIYVIPFAAGGFIYIAAADLIPNMHKTEGFEKITSFIWLCLGLGFMITMKVLLKA